MKMSVEVLRGCGALFFALTSVSAVQKKLNSINDLKKINFGQSVPKHSLVLLFWFANIVDINNNIIRLTFNRNSDYGSHHYVNSEGLLDPLPLGNEYEYFTIGNLNEPTSMQLPSYVLQPRAEYDEGNRDRIIFRVREQGRGRRAWQRIDQVFITQHYHTYEHRGSAYDPARTYRITVNLLRQIREFSMGENLQELLYLRNNHQSNADVTHIRNTWGDLAGLGLLLFIVINKSNSSNKHNNRRGNRQNHLDDDASERERRSNVSYFAVSMDDDEGDQTASRMTGNRGSGRSFCCICCICFCVAVGIILLGILVFYFFHKRG